MGPFTPEWTKTSLSALKGRFRLLRKTLPTARKWRSRVGDPFLRDQKVNLDRINREALTNYPLDSETVKNLLKPDNPQSDISNTPNTPIGRHPTVHFGPGSDVLSRKSKSKHSRHLSHHSHAELRSISSYHTLNPIFEEQNEDPNSTPQVRSVFKRANSLGPNFKALRHKLESEGPLTDVSPIAPSLLSPEHAASASVSLGMSSVLSSSSVSPSFVTALAPPTDVFSFQSSVIDNEPRNEYSPSLSMESLDRETPDPILQSDIRPRPAPKSIFSRQSMQQTIDENRAKVQQTFDKSFKGKHIRRHRVADEGLSKLLSLKQKGEIIAAEKLLVMVKGTKLQFISPQFNEVETIDTRVIERWKEYVVVARNTGNESAPILLQFHKVRKVDKIQSDMERPVSDIDTVLTPETFVKFYSTLDKTIVFWRSTPKGSLLYILRARSHESSLRWLSLFLRTLGVQKNPLLHLGIPNLNLAMQLRLPLDMIQEEQERMAASRKNGPLSIAYQNMNSNISRASPLLQYLFAITAKLLNQAGYTKTDILNALGINKLGLSWRRYDRLEWMDQGNEESIYYHWVLSNSHELEMRIKKPYNSFVTFEDGVEMEEPIPIEGYLLRLTTWTGRVTRYRGHLNRHFYETLYFHTHDNLLFYSKTKNSMAPHPSARIAHHLISRGNGTFSVPKEFSNELIDLYKGAPLVYEVMPFKTNDDGDIEWLRGNTDKEDVERHDAAALFEIQRRVSMLENADGFIDLCAIEIVRPVNGNLEESQSPLFDHNMPDFDVEKAFEIVMKTGTVIRLQAYNIHTRDIWIERLAELSRYWKRRLYEDVARINEVRVTNLTRLHLNPESGIEPFISASSFKWESTLDSMADAYLFPAVGNSWSRSISIRGTLYQKPKKHASFRQYQVVLCHGKLILYTMFGRTSLGKVKSRVDNRKFQTIDLTDSSCYVYSGPITEGDLLQGRDKSFDSQNPGSYYVPRVYSDGWKSTEAEGQRCFVLWFGKKKPLTDTNQESLRVKFVNRLGTLGISMVFLARSRQERDLWVLALNNEIERVAEEATQDIVIT